MSWRSIAWATARCASLAKGIWGPPADKAECIRVLKRFPELGVNFIDTADSYGPDVSEPLIREALHPYKGLVIATKGGLTRPGPDQWVAERPARISDQTGACQPEAARAWNASICGSCIGSIRRCRVRNSSARSKSCSTKA